MTGPQYPQYPHGPDYPSQRPYYPAGGYPPQQHAAPPGANVLQQLGSRVARRPAPRFGVTLAGVGVALVVLGVLVWSITYLLEGVVDSFTNPEAGPPSDSRRFLGFVLALVVVGIGYALIIKVRTGPLVTAGVAASALGVPVAIEFLTIDLTGGDPINTDAVVWVSVVVYLLSYLFVRGARGHTFYLGLTAFLLWEYAVGKAGPSASEVGSSVVRPFAGAGVGGDVVPSVDTTTIAGVSLVFAVGYYLIAWALDRSGRHGMALPFVLVGLPAMVVGIGTLAPHTKQVGTGIVLLLVGLLLSRYGAHYERRFTAWFWGLVAAAGPVVIATQFAKSGTSVGITMIVLGIAFVVGGAIAARALREPDDMAAVTPAPQGVPVG